MARLGELSNLQSERGRAMLALMLEHSPYLRFLDENSGFEEMATAFIYHVVGGAAVLQRRSLGGEYNADDRTPPNALNGQLAFVGDSIDIDDSHVADDERGLLQLERWIDKELNSSGMLWVEAFEAELFQGTGAGSPRQVTGLKTLLDGVTDIPGIPGYTGVADASDADPAGGTSFDLSTPDHYDAFVEYMVEQVETVDDARGIVFNKSLYGRMFTVARNTHILGESRDLFGNPVPTFHGIPFVKVRNETITNDEPDNAGTANTNTTSLYIESPGEGKRSVATNSGLDFDDFEGLDRKESQNVKWEVRGDNTVQKKDVIRRVRNIKL